MPRRLTAADVCAVTGYSRDELHAILRSLWPYAEDKPSPRVAREFTPKDLLVLSVTQVLENQFGLRRTAVSALGPQLQAALAGPKDVSRNARLVITVQPPLVEYVDEESVDGQGVVVALGPLFERVDGHLNFDGQLSLQLGPGLVQPGSLKRHY